VIEDWGTGYWPNFPDGHRYEGPYAAPGHSGPPPTVEPRETGGLARLRARLTRSPGRERFPSHDYGMVGFVKTLVDAVAVDTHGPLPRDARRVSGSEIASVKFLAAQVFVQKAT
jgi:hypothetical protein